MTNHAHPPKVTRRIPLWLWVAGPLLVILLYIGNTLYSATRATTDDAYLKGQKLQIAAPVSGLVTRVAVQQNQPVKQGDLLFQIDPIPFELALTEAEAALAAEDNQSSADRAGIQGAQAALSSAATSVQYASQDLARLQALSDKQLISQKLLFDARHVLDQAQASRRQAIAALAEAKAPLSKGASPRLDALKAQLAQARYNLAHTRVVAPIAGTVAPHDLQVGEFLTPGQPALTMFSRRLWVEANFKETDLKRLKPGQTATIVLDIDPGQPLKARVQSISPAAGSEFSIIPAQNASGNWVKIVQRVPVRLELVDPPQGLQAGLSAHVTVSLRP